MYLNSFYIQKSKLMLYPWLELPKTELQPHKTYIAYKHQIKFDDHKLICMYKRLNDEKYYKYRNDALKNHPLFIEHIRSTIYDFIIFDLSKYKEDWNYFMKGKYSKFSKETKALIMKAYDNTEIGPLLLDTHLNPAYYHELYAQELGADIDILKKTYETLSPPDLEKEWYQ